MSIQREVFNSIVFINIFFINYNLKITIIIIGLHQGFPNFFLFKEHFNNYFFHVVLH